MQILIHGDLCIHLLEHGMIGVCGFSSRLAQLRVAGIHTGPVIAGGVVVVLGPVVQNLVSVGAQFVQAARAHHHAVGRALWRTPLHFVSLLVRVTYY